MKSIAVVSQKGGVGKTTLALNLAFSLARNNFRVALIDTDPQGAIGYSLQGIADSPGLVGCVMEGISAERALLSTRFKDFGILPLGELAPQDHEAFGDQLSNGQALGRVLAELSSRFELCVVDTPSGFGGVTMGALRAVDWALSPLQAEPVALRTLPQLLTLLGCVRDEGASVELLGLVLCMLQQRNGDSLAVAEEVWSKLPADLVFETTIPRDSAVLSASAAGVPLGLVSRMRPPPIAHVFDQLAAELVPRLGLTEEGNDDEPLGLFA